MSRLLDLNKARLQCHFLNKLYWWNFFFGNLAAQCSTTAVEVLSETKFVYWGSCWKLRLWRLLLTPLILFSFETVGHSSEMVWCLLDAWEFHAFSQEHSKSRPFMRDPTLLKSDLVFYSPQYVSCGAVKLPLWLVADSVAHDIITAMFLYLLTSQVSYTWASFEASTSWQTRVVVNIFPLPSIRQPYYKHVGTPRQKCRVRITRDEKGSSNVAF